MKKITLKFSLMLALSVITYSVSAQEQVADGPFSAPNTSASGQENVFNTPTFSVSSDNFSNQVAGGNDTWPNLFLDAPSVPRLVQQVSAPAGEGYKFVVSDQYKPMGVTKVTYILANATSNQGADDVPSKWVVQASNDDTIWDDLCDPITIYSTNSGAGKKFNIDLNTTKPYRAYRFVLAEAWTPKNPYTALQYLDFIVDSTVLSTIDKDVSNNLITVYPNPSNSFLNIKSNVNVAIERVALVDVTGKEIFNQTNAQPIDVRKFSKGLYILQVKSQEGAVTSKKVLVN